MSDKPSSPREGEREGGRDRSVAPVRTPLFALYTLLLYDLCRRRRVVIPLAVPGGVKYGPSVDAHCCCYVPFPLPKREEQLFKFLRQVSFKYHPLEF